MAAAQGPSPEDFNVFSKFFETISYYGNWFTGGGIGTLLTLIWRVRGKLSDFETAQARHADQIKELRDISNAHEEKIGRHATKDDLDAAVGAITGEFRARMSDMTQLIAMRGSGK